MLIDAIKSLFGKGTMTFEFTTTKRKGTVKVPFVGDPSTFGESDLQDIKDEINTKLPHGETLTDIRYKGKTKS